MGLFGPPDIRKMKAKQDIPGLIKALEYKKDDQIREAAAKALGQVGDALAVDPLINVLKNPILPFNLRKAAVDALGEIGDGKAVDPLVIELKNPRKSFQQSVVVALGKISDPRAMEHLIPALKDTDLHKSAAMALGACGKSDLKPLIAALKDDDWRVRSYAAEILGQINNPQAVKPLVNTLDDPANVVRVPVIKALGAIGDGHAIEPLIPFLKDVDNNIRSSASEALEYLGWQPGDDEMKAWYCLANKHWDQCITFGKIAIKPLITALKDKDNDIRVEAARLLGIIGDPQAIQPLIEALKIQKSYKENSSRVSIIAAQSLALIGVSAVEPLITALKDPDPDVRSGAATALGKIGDGCAVEPLIEALKDELPNVRWSAASALGQLGDARGVDALIAALSDENYGVQQNAAAALGQIGDPRAVKPLITKLPNVNAIKALGMIGDGSATDALIPLLKHEELYTRKSAAEVLVGFYQANVLTEPQKQLVFKNRSHITTQHKDQEVNHMDYEGASDCHHDHANHEDNKGIGIAFPV